MKKYNAIMYILCIWKVECYNDMLVFFYFGNFWKIQCYHDMLVIYFVFFVVGNATNNTKGPVLFCGIRRVVSLVATTK